MDSHNCYAEVTKFSLRVYRQVANSDKPSSTNMVVSPTGILLSLTALVSGAGDSTLSELLRALGFASEAELAAFAIGFQDELADLHSSSSSSGLEMSLLRKIYTDTSLRSIYVSKIMDVLKVCARRRGFCCWCPRLSFVVGSFHEVRQKPARKVS